MSLILGVLGWLCLWTGVDTAHIQWVWAALVLFIVGICIHVID